MKTNCFRLKLCTIVKQSTTIPADVLSCRSNQFLKRYPRETGGYKKCPTFNMQRERQSPIQMGICYNEWVFAMVATTHWVLATVANTHL